jgi:uncharacterized protein (TIGR03067 family)
MRRVLPLLIVLSLGFAPAPVYKAPKPVAPKSDLERMQGKWVVVRQSRNGEDMAARPSNYTVEIVGDRFRHFIGGRLLAEWSIRLDATKRIKEIDRKKLGGEVVSGPTALLGIYRLDGDSLQIAYISGGRGRPLDFDGKGRGEDDCVSSFLKRVKK